MDGDSNNNSSSRAVPPPPPPPPPTGGTPPASPADASPKESYRRSPRPPLASSTSSSGGLGRQRPQLVRRDSSSQASFSKRRERLASDSSFQSHGSGDRSGLRRRSARPNVSFEPQHIRVMSDQPPAPMSNDTRLLLASLDHEAVEDEAEATLLNVLERRQGNFAQPNILLPPVHPTGIRHRRGRSQHAGALPNIDLLNLGNSGSSEMRPSSAPSSSETRQTLSRPGLPTRGISLGNSRRNLLAGSPPDMNRRSFTADYESGAQDELVQNFSELSDPHGLEMMVSDSNSHKESHDGEDKDSATRLSQSKVPGYSSRDRGSGYNRHGRTKSSLPPNLFERAISDSSTSASGLSGLSTPGEKARFLAMTMKTVAAQNADETPPEGLGDGKLTDLMNIMEAQRDNDSLGGSVKKSGGSHRSGDGASRSMGSRSRMSRSAENQSKGGSSAFSGSGRGFRGRPFSGVSASNPFSTDGGFMSNVDQLFQFAEHVQDLCEIPEGDEDDDMKDVVQSSDVLEQENANFLSQLVGSHPEVPPAYSEDGLDTQNEGGVDEKTPMLPTGGQNKGRRIPQFSPRPNNRYTNIFSSITQPTPGSRFYKFLLWWSHLRKSMRMFAVAFDVAYVKEILWGFLSDDVPMFILPALAVSAFFYYRLGNPTCSFLPTDASVSWWILFVIRHYLTYHLAYVAEYILIDVMATRSLISVKLIGPLPTLYLVNAKGWPFILNAWALLNLLLIQQGRNAAVFYAHWLSWTDIEMFTPDNPGGAIVNSAVYKRILLSCNIAGVATCLKRTILALYLGKRVFIHYKPKLEKVMESMILLTEVADLGNAVDEFEFEKVENPEVTERSESRKSASRSTSLQDRIRVSTMIEAVGKKDIGQAESESDADEENMDDESKSSSAWNRLRAQSQSSDENEPMEKIPSHETFDKIPDEAAAEEEFVPIRATTEENLFTEELPAMDNTPPPINTVEEPVRGVLREVSTTTRIKSLLDEWEEPVNKQDKMADPTIHEILQFRTATRFLDDTHPFGSSFGPAHTRDSCIKSAKGLYTRLLELTPGSPTLNFDIIGVLAYNIDGTFDQKKARSLVRLFRPDKFDNVSLLHFVQSCDGVYKKLRYLRASLGNSTLIDSVLENIFNTVFFFILALTIMSVMQLNPWTLLVSMSTVLVSFAFALGPSAAKLIEGMIMIAVRRPYDLGDRIAIVETTGAPDDTGDPGYHDTWFVEDVNLFTTTLRLSRSNEVSTVNNGSIANTRIVNHGRSLKALVNIELPMNIEVMHDQVQIVKSALQQYIRDNPRIWACLVNFRITKVEPFNGLIVYSARVQHVKSWQDLLPVSQGEHKETASAFQKCHNILASIARGDLEKFCTEILFKLGIHFETYVSTVNTFIKEFPEQDFLPEEQARYTDETLQPEVQHDHDE